MAGPLERLSHTGAAVPSTLSAPLSASALTFTIGATGGWPTGAGGQNFVVVIDSGLNQEKVLCSSQAGGTVTVVAAGRGFDGTVGLAHVAGVAVEHVFSALEADDANRHIYTPTADDHPLYVPATGTRPFTGLITFQAGLTDTGTLTQTGPVNITGNETVTGTLAVSGATSTGSPLSSSGDITAVGSVTGTDFVASGLTGATSPSRFLGSTASGHPTSGTYQLGDFVIDQTGAIWICSAPGTPGTWVSSVPTSYPQGYLVSATNATTTDYVGLSTVISLAVPVVHGRQYTITANVAGTESVSSGGPRAQITDDQGNSTWVLLQNNVTPVGQSVADTAVALYTPTSTKTATILLQAQDVGGTFHIPAGSCTMWAEDIGT